MIDATDQNLRHRLDRIKDILWAGGVTNAVTCIEQVSYCKPQVGETAPEEDWAELIRVVLIIEAEITKGLERLLAEIES